MVLMTLDQQIIDHERSENDLTISTMLRIARKMGLTNPDLFYDLYECVVHKTEEFKNIYRDFELRYLQSLQPGEKVIETDKTSCMYGKTGEVYISQNEMTKGSKCVKWEIGMGTMGTSVTHGTRRIKDIK